jgi:hypothetical protein
LIDQQAGNFLPVFVFKCSDNFAECDLAFKANH